MSEVVTAAPAPPVVRLPPAVRGPKLFQGLAFVVSRRRLLGLDHMRNVGPPCGVPSGRPQP